MSTDPVAQARSALVEAGITGPHRSHSRQNNIFKIRALLDGDSEAAFGLSGLAKYSATEVLSFLSDLTGCSRDIEELSGEDTMDPSKTVDAILAGARKLKKHAEVGDALLCVTGHPTGLLEHHMRVVDAFRSAGGQVMLAREGEKLGFGRGKAEVRYVGGVGCLADGASLRHTHSSEAMERLLDSTPWPDVVMGDHGFAGAAIERSIPTVAVMDINDPALAIAWAEHKDCVVIPMDDNRQPRLYESSWKLFQGVLAGDL